VKRHPFDPFAFLVGVAIVVLATIAWSGDLASNINDGRWIAPAFVVAGITVTAVALQRHRRQSVTRTDRSANNFLTNPAIHEPDSAVATVVASTTTSDWS
jgi:hypothetical protein